MTKTRCWWCGKTLHSMPNHNTTYIVRDPMGYWVVVHEVCQGNTIAYFKPLTAIPLEKPTYVPR